MTALLHVKKKVVIIIFLNFLHFLAAIHERFKLGYQLLVVEVVIIPANSYSSPSSHVLWNRLGNEVIAGDPLLTHDVVPL